MSLGNWVKEAFILLLREVSGPVFHFWMQSSPRTYFNNSQLLIFILKDAKFCYQDTV